MPRKNHFEIYAKYRRSREAKGPKLEIKMKRTLPELDRSVFLSKFEEFGPCKVVRLIEVHHNSGEVVYTDQRKFFQSYTETFLDNQQNISWHDSMMMYSDGEKLHVTLHQMEGIYEAYDQNSTIVTLHEQPLTVPFEDGISGYLANLIPLLLSFLPFDDLVKAQAVSRRFRAAVRSLSTWKLFFERCGITIPQQLENAISYPRVCKHILDVNKRAEMIKNLFNSIEPKGESCILPVWNHGTVPWLSMVSQSDIKIKSIEPWTRKTILTWSNTKADPVEIIEGDIQDWAEWMSSTLGGPNIPPRNKLFMVRVMFEPEKMEDFGIEAAEGRHYEVNLDVLYDHLSAVFYSPTELLVPDIMLENDWKFMKQIIMYDSF